MQEEWKTQVEAFEQESEANVRPLPPRGCLFSCRSDLSSPSSLPCNRNEKKTKIRSIAIKEKICVWDWVNGCCISCVVCIMEMRVYFCVVEMRAWEKCTLCQCAWSIALFFCFEKNFTKGSSKRRSMSGRSSSAGVKHR